LLRYDYTATARRRKKKKEDSPQTHLLSQLTGKKKVRSSFIEQKTPEKKVTFLHLDSNNKAARKGRGSL